MTTGICPSCKNWFTARPWTGLIRLHRDDRGALCPGSGERPQEETP